MTNPVRWLLSLLFIVQMYLAMVVLAFAYDSRTKGNAATEIVKYFFQLHYDVKKDYRNFDLVVRDNFYRGN